MALSEQTIEVHGEDVEQAIEDGLKELGVARSDVEIEIIDSGSSGFLGIGGREAIVRLTLSSTAAAVKEVVAISTEPGDESGETVGTIEDRVMAAEPAVEIEETEAESQEGEVALGIVENLLEQLQIEASVTLTQTEPDDLTGERRWLIEIYGDDLGALIGSRGETLNALQHISRLMTGHVIHRRPQFIVDIQDYRKKREKAMVRLAERMAGKVVKRGRPITLEPMPPNERRIIHITLREDERVYTESYGEGRKRRVRIYPSEE